MAETDLHISERLRALLPIQSEDQRAGLKEQITKAGKVRDKLVFWHDGKRNVIVDGMTRWDIILETHAQYDTEEMHFADYEEAELWMLENQLCRRNVTDLASLRKLRGEIYNRLKAKHGGDRKGKESSGQIGHLIEEAEKVADKVGSSTRTMRRDGARLETVAKLSKGAQAIADKATDADIKALEKLDSGQQDQVARAVRTGQAKTVKEAMKGFKPPVDAKPDKPTKPPKKYDRSFWYKQWNHSIGPMVRLVDKIAADLGESKCDSQKTVQDHLNVATEEMMEWLGVKR